MSAWMRRLGSLRGVRRRALLAEPPRGGPHLARRTELVVERDARARAAPEAQQDAALNGFERPIPPRVADGPLAVRVDAACADLRLLTGRPVYVRRRTVSFDELGEHGAASGPVADVTELGIRIAKSKTQGHPCPRLEFNALTYAIADRRIVLQARDRGPNVGAVVPELGDVHTEAEAGDFGGQWRVRRRGSTVRHKCFPQFPGACAARLGGSPPRPQARARGLASAEPSATLRPRRPGRNGRARGGGYGGSSRVRRRLVRRRGSGTRQRDHYAKRRQDPPKNECNSSAGRSCHRCPHSPEALDRSSLEP